MTDVRIELEELLAARHQAPEWATFLELRNQTGYGRQERRFDVAAFNLWPSRRQWRVVYEVKRSRGDFLRELAAPEKREEAERYFHETWIATAHGVCSADEVPDGWGLIVATKDGTKLRTVRAARQREPEEIPYTMMLSLLRRTADTLHELRGHHTVRYAGRELSEDDFRALLEAEASHVRDLLETERRVVRQERKELDSARELLEAPLTALASAAQRWDLRRDALMITVEDVDNMIARAAERRIEGLTAKLREAHGAIGSVCSALGADDGDER